MTAAAGWHYLLYASPSSHPVQHAFNGISIHAGRCMAGRLFDLVETAFQQAMRWAVACTQPEIAIYVRTVSAGGICRGHRQYPQYAADALWTDLSPVDCPV